MSTSVVAVLFSALFGSAVVLMHAATEQNAESGQLSKCKHLDPYEDLVGWAKAKYGGNCDPESPKEKKDVPETEKKRYEWGFEKFAYDIIASDKIGPSRLLPKQYHELCDTISYQDLSLEASVVIIYHNEGLSVIIRMLNSIFRETPAKYLKEIVLYDDSSEKDTLIENYIREYGVLTDWPMDKIKIHRSDDRLGLIKAKVYASRIATGDVLIFLDSHCEVTSHWIEPLLMPIQEDRTRIVLPVVDLINPITFQYSKAMVAKSGFDWTLHIVWKYFPWSYFDTPVNNIKPFKSPSMSGGLLAVNRKFFKEMGEYDTGMEIWGAENIEMAVRMWLCGGTVMVAPCSHVGHVFRMYRPYSPRTSPGVDSHLFNSLRTVKVWFDGFDKKFYDKRPRAKNMDPGDLVERYELKKRLNCKPFEWYINEIYPDLKGIVHEEL